MTGEDDGQSQEETSSFHPKYDANGLIPVITTDAVTGHVLMLAYMNEAALARTLATGEMHYWSRSRRALWHKGATSGHFQHLERLKIDCDQDTLLAEVRQTGAACHTGRPGCFYRELTVPAGAVRDSTAGNVREGDDAKNIITLKVQPKTPD